MIVLIKADAKKIWLSSVIQNVLTLITGFAHYKKGIYLLFCLLINDNKLEGARVNKNKFKNIILSKLKKKKTVYNNQKSKLFNNIFMCVFQLVFQTWIFLRGLESIVF